MSEKTILLRCYRCDSVLKDKGRDNYECPVCKVCRPPYGRYASTTAPPVTTPVEENLSTRSER